MIETGFARKNSDGGIFWASTKYYTIDNNKIYYRVLEFSGFVDITYFYVNIGVF